MSKRKRADTCATPSTATGTATSSSLPPRPSAVMAGNDDAWWAQAVKHTLDSVDTEDLDLDTKRRLNTALEAALGKAAKRACTDLSNADGFTCTKCGSREGGSDNVDGAGREGKAERMTMLAKGIAAAT